MWRMGDYIISTDRSLLDFSVVHGFISHESYWAQGRSAEAMAKAMNNSAYCFGLYHETPGGLDQVGFARVVSDLLTFGYLADVFVVAAHRGQGLGKWLIRTVVEHPELSTVGRLALATNTPDFYVSAGFTLFDQNLGYKYMVRNCHG